MKSQVLNSKKELFNYMQVSISTAYKQLTESQKLNYDSSLLKTYLIEHDIPNNGDIEFYLKNNFFLKEGLREIEPTIRRTNDDDLINVNFDGFADLYIDTSHSRIWNLYSLSNSISLKKIIDKVSNSVFFDKIWLHHDFLLNLRLKDNTHTRGFGLNFDYSKFESDEDISPILKMQLSGIKTSSTVFDILQKVDELKNNLTLSKIKLKTYNTEDASSFILEDVQYFGKITARGNDITQHISNTQSIKKSYFDILKNIESNYRIGWKNTNGKLNIEGYPIYFVKKDGIEMDVDLVCEKIFDGKNPFKLFGTPSDIPGGKLINVYDLHIGGVFDVQVFPDMFVFYINQEVCGNTILRFYTNLQHTFSNSFKIENDNEEDILQSAK